MDACVSDRFNNACPVLLRAPQIIVVLLYNITPTDRTGRITSHYCDTTSCSGSCRSALIRFAGINWSLIGEPMLLVALEPSFASNCQNYFQTWFHIREACLSFLRLQHVQLVTPPSGASSRKQHLHTWRPSARSVWALCGLLGVSDNMDEDLKEGR